MSVRHPIQSSPERQAIWELMGVVDTFVEHWRSHTPMTEGEVKGCQESYEFAAGILGIELEPTP